MSNAYEMAVDVLGLALTSRKTENMDIPVASEPFEIQTFTGVTRGLVTEDRHVKISSKRDIAIMISICYNV